MSNPEQEKVEEIWLNLAEAAALTGYNIYSLRKAIWRIAQDAEEERPVKLRKRSNGWEVWLPDLIEFLKEPRRGPQPKRK